MKRGLKIAGAVLLVLIAAGFLLLRYIASRPAAPGDYQQRVQTGSAAEAKYMSGGSFAVSVYEAPVLQVFKQYTIYYPTELETSGQQYPVIVLCNGSGTPVSQYPAVPKHYASWGFIVIGTEEEYAWNGFGAEMSVRYLEKLNASRQLEENEPNIFYQKIDLDHVGIVGHSQGGVGVLNAITAQEHKNTYQAAVSLSPTNQELANALDWNYDASLIDIPILLISGAGGGDDWVVTGEQLADIYNDIAGSKVMARRRDTVHNEVLYSANGYVTAWFLWHLQGDTAASGIFTGASPDLSSNPLYQDQHFSITQ